MGAGRTRRAYRICLFFLETGVGSTVAFSNNGRRIETGRIVEQTGQTRRAVAAVAADVSLPYQQRRDEPDP